MSVLTGSHNIWGAEASPLGGDVEDPYHVDILRVI